VKGHLARTLMVAVALGVSQPGLSQIQTAKVTGGELEGVVKDGVASFRGIPFAAPPLGELRWKAPQPVKPWTSVKKADSFGPGCMQDTSMAAKMGMPTEVSEDCLYLNVWTAANKRDEKRPVMVWIYGGAFAGGMTSAPLYDGTRLAKKGVVLVSVAYRVGPFGFLAHAELSKESGKGSGTYGLQDQIAGLRWVRDNIAQFGGDPSRVTIFGESAGGISVSMLAASPAAKGLFHRAISESGGSFAPAKFDNEAGQNVLTLRMAEVMGVSLLNRFGVEDIKAARKVGADQILQAAGGMGFFWPVADGEVLLGDQYELYQAGKFNDTPILIGTNSDEGAMFVRPGVTPAAFDRQIRTGYGPAAAAILAAYPHATDAEAFKSAKDIFRESAFAWHTWAWATLQAQKGKGKVFVYFFDHRTPFSPEGASHGAEMSYVFGNLGGFGGAPTAADVALSDLMSTCWVNFATTGDPNGPGLPNWPVFTATAQNVMFFDGDASARALPNQDKLKALDGYYAWRREEARKKR
jgi:para-nitrobenzyl esterase